MSENVPIKAVDRTLAILQTLGEYDTVGVTALAEDLDLPRSTVFNHLKTLESGEYVVNDGGEYRLGSRFLELGAKARDFHDVYEAARGEVSRLAEETGEISALLIEEHGLGVFLYRSEGEGSVHIDSFTGQRIYLHGAALGKAILAGLPESRVDGIVQRRGLPTLTDNTVTERDELSAELAEIAEAGVAFDDEERLDGLRSVAAPIYDGEEVLGSVSLAGPSSRVYGDRFREEFPAKVADAASAAELNLTYS
ncbi:MAG: IclR family transcriptional regulator [Halobacteriales archaeon SW_9_67_25]|nr:MAG: IclR family transcriptional regulator [Halobacteriales archaeon SW_9_67_25]